MSRVFKRPEAENDLNEIWWYIAKDNPLNADKFLDSVQRTCLTLADFPQMGTIRDEIKDELRSQPVGNYLIFYFPLENGIDIVRVLHGSRDIESMM